MTLTRIDLNADAGEGSPHDEAVFAAGVTSVNLACGGHAGDAASMTTALKLARRYGLAVGAHPSFPDREGFGRRDFPFVPFDIWRWTTEQVGDLREAARLHGLLLAHVKPHGALYHALNRNAPAARAFVQAVLASAPGAAIYGPPRGELAEAARRCGLRFVAEGFADRGYTPDGELIPRGHPGDLIADPLRAAEQAVALARAGRFGTLCTHGDGPTAAAILHATRLALEAAGFEVTAPRI